MRHRSAVMTLCRESVARGAKRERRRDHDQPPLAQTAYNANNSQVEPLKQSRSGSDCGQAGRRLRNIVNEQDCALPLFHLSFLDCINVEG
jgi:hypothetical protein